MVLSSYYSAMNLIISQVNNVNAVSRYDMIPLIDYITMSKLLIQSIRFQEATGILSKAIQVYPSSSTLYLLLAVSFIRLESYREAEKALQYANILDNRNPDTWAYYCLLCLADRGSRIDDDGTLKGPNRYEEANTCLNQAIRLSLSNTTLLRELTISYIAIDKLSIAEDLIRRAMNIESSVSENNKANQATRKLFADILAGQNQAMAAINEYQLVITGESTNNNNNSNDADEIKVKLQSAEKCIYLLESLGRFEDIASVRNIIDVLQEQLTHQQKLDNQMKRGSSSSSASSRAATASSLNVLPMRSTVSSQ